MSTLQRAIEIAVEAHHGQKDKNGMPYILHPLRLMFQMKSDSEKMAAVLHNVVEDSDWTLEQLKSEGFNGDVIEAVNLLTRDDKDTYMSSSKRLHLTQYLKLLKLLISQTI